MFQAYLSRTQKVFQYLGIPYAQPPVRELRFAAPVTDPLPMWGGTRNASTFAPSCPQMTSRRKLHERLYLRLLPQDQPDPGLNEDCLYLNIYVPDSEFFIFLNLIETVVNDKLRNKLSAKRCFYNKQGFSIQ